MSDLANAYIPEKSIIALIPSQVASNVDEKPMLLVLNCLQPKSIAQDAGESERQHYCHLHDHWYGGLNQ